MNQNLSTVIAAVCSALFCQVVSAQSIQGSETFIFRDADNLVNPFGIGPGEAKDLLNLGDDECARAVAFMKQLIRERKVLAYTAEDIDELAAENCGYLIRVVAGNRGFKTREQEARELEKRHAEQVRSGQDRLSEQMNRLLSQVNTPEQARNLASQATAKAIDAAASHALSEGKYDLYNALSDAAGKQRNLASTAEATAESLESKSAAKASVNVHPANHPRPIPPRISHTSELLETAADAVESFHSDPANIYGGVDPIGVATDNMEDIWPDGAVGKLVEPIRAVNEGIKKYEKLLDELPSSSPVTSGRGPTQPYSGALWETPTSNLSTLAAIPGSANSPRQPRMTDVTVALDPTIKNLLNIDITPRQPNTAGVQVSGPVKTPPRKQVANLLDVVPATATAPNDSIKDLLHLPIPPK